MIDGDIVTMPKGVTDYPIIVTVGLLDQSQKKKNMFVLDTTKEEEECASTQVSFAMDPNGNIYAEYINILVKVHCFVLI